MSKKNTRSVRSNKTHKYASRENAFKAFRRAKAKATK